MGMKRIKDSIKLLRFNLGSIIIFEVLLKIISYALLVPFLYWMFNLSIRLAGISYLAKSTVDNYFKSPFTYLILLLFLLLLSCFLMINISGLIYAMEASNRMQKINVFQMLIKGTRNALRIFYYKNILMFLYVIVFLPITNITMVSATMVQNLIPDYILDYIKSNSPLMEGLFALYVILALLGLFTIYTLNYFTLKKRTFTEAVRDSENCVKTWSVKPILGILFWNILLAVTAILLGGVFTSFIMTLVKKLVTYKAAYFLLDHVLQMVNLVIYIIFSIVVMPLTYAYICNSYYDMEEDTGDETENIDNYTDYDPVKSGMRERAFVVLMILIALTLDISYMILKDTKILTIDAEFNNTATVTAHRGDAKNAPENTLSAFSLAISNQADVIELDVRQTKDGEIIVMHDENLKRTTGEDELVGNLTFAEIRELDAGVQFGERYPDEKIPSLEEVIQFVDGRVDLNIELKPADTDQNLVERVVELVQQYDLYDNCVLASQDYNVLREIKLLDDKITTVYVMSMAAGEFYTLEYADVFSIKHTFITTDMVKKAHRNGKEVYAWTVNSESRIQELLLKGVDSIITDNPYYAKKIIYNSEDSILTSWMKKYMNGVW